MARITIDQALQHAFHLQQAGQLAEAEGIYRQILATQPDNSDAFHFLGVIAYQSGQNESAVELMTRAVHLKSDDPNSLNNLGLALQRLKKHDEALAIYHRSLKINPDSPQAQYNCGNALLALGKYDDAIINFRRALTLDPNNINFHLNLGNALKAKGEFDEAIASYRHALAMNPRFADAWNNLGAAQAAQEQWDEAIACYRQAIDCGADDFEILTNLGDALVKKEDWAGAIASYRKAMALNPQFPVLLEHFAIALRMDGNLSQALMVTRQLLKVKPDCFDAFNELGIAFSKLKQNESAIACFRQVLEISPDLLPSIINLGNSLRDSGDLSGAEAQFRRAIQLRPDRTETYNNLGVALLDQSKWEEAQACFERLVAAMPKKACYWNNLGNVRKDSGQLEEALHCYRRATDLDSSDATSHGNLVFFLHYRWDHSAQEILNEARTWDEIHARPLRKPRQFANVIDPERRLRIGYISPDFCTHVVGLNMAPLFQAQTHEHFEYFAYSNTAKPDELTQRMQKTFEVWRDIARNSDEEIAEQIVADRIDILVDLTLHSAHNRLLVLARKPAPVQVTFAGYPGTTGMSAIDYRLTDPFLDPLPPSGVIDPADAIYSEKSVRLPHSFWCYGVFGNEPTVNALPALSGSPFMFGCLNAGLKVGDHVLRLWAKVLRQVPDSHLLLMGLDESYRERIRTVFRQQEIDPDRMEFVGRQPRFEYLKTYNRIDLGLDTFPYNAHTTGLDALWMGVPTITLFGNTVVSRAGWSQLSNLKLTELAAHNEEQFVEIAARTAADLPRLAELRATMRNRMIASPLMNGPQFARGIEGAYRTMWRTWCQQQTATSIP